MTDYLFNPLIGETVTSVRYGVWAAEGSEDQCETVVELTCESGKVVMVAATDDINERYFSTFIDFQDVEGGWLESLVAEAPL